MDAEEFTEALEDILDNLDPDADILYDQVKRVTTYENTGLLTYDKGLVVRMHDGTEFQVTVKRSK